MYSIYLPQVIYLHVTYLHINILSCDIFAYTNYFFMYATKQYTKIHFTCLVTTFHVPRHVLNSQQTATQTHHCTGCLLYRLRAVF